MGANSQGTNERLIERLLELRDAKRAAGNNDDADMLNEAIDALATKWGQEPESRNDPGPSLTAAEASGDYMAKLPSPTASPCVARRTVAPDVDGRDFYELCQQYRHAQEMMPYGMPNVVQCFDNLREYIKTGKLPWPSYQLSPPERSLP